MVVFFVFATVICTESSYADKTQTKKPSNIDFCKLGLGCSGPNCKKSQLYTENITVQILSFTPKSDIVKEDLAKFVSKNLPRLFVCPSRLTKGGQSGFKHDTLFSFELNSKGIAENVLVLSTKPPKQFSNCILQCLAGKKLTTSKKLPSTIKVKGTVLYRREINDIGAD